MTSVATKFILPSSEAATGVLVGEATTQTLTNKTLKEPVFTDVNDNEYTLDDVIGGGDVVLEPSQFQPEKNSQDVLTNWKLSETLPSGLQNSNWRSVCYGNGIFVGVNDAGTCMYSTDGGKTWSASSTTNMGSFQSVSFGNGTFVAIRSSGTTAWFSNNGISWRESSPIKTVIVDDTAVAQSLNLYSITYGDGKFVAVGENSGFDGSVELSFWSYDGSTWNDGFIDGETSGNSTKYVSIAYGKGVFIAVGGKATSKTTKCKISGDGINWSSSLISSTEEFWIRVCYGNELFVAVANSNNICAVSKDFGQTWSEYTITETSKLWIDLCYGNGRFMLISSDSDKMFYSYDGINWVVEDIGESKSWKCLCYGKDRNVLLCNDSKAYYYIHGKSDISRTRIDSILDYSINDNMNWTTKDNSVTSANWRSICYGNGKFVAVADSNKIAYSYDGINWTTKDNGSEFTASWRSICYGNGKFVAVASSNSDKIA